MRYAELRYPLPSSLSELAADALIGAGATGIEERDASTIERPAPGEVVLVAWIPPDEADAFVARAADALAAHGVATDRCRPARSERDEDEWRDAWKRYFHARPVGRFVIVPSWEKYAPASGEVVLDLDPGRAFGTGGHASTRLCLRAIDELSAEHDRALDVGCGSGVLAIAAARRWPRLRGAGVDIDADAIEVSRENAERNGVAERLAFSTTPIAKVEERADLVLANIQPEILIPMAEQLIAHLAPTSNRPAALILAGIVDESAADVERAFVAAGLAAPRMLREEGWTALVFQVTT